MNNEVKPKSRQVLMNPGPVLVDERVRQAMSLPDLCHREPEFAELMARVSRKVTRVCGGDGSYTSVVFSGSGTAAVEAALSSIVPPGGRILILDNGHYGERLAKIAGVHGISHLVIRFGWATPFDLTAIDRALRDDPAITHVGIVHHETSTGMLNPLREVGEIAARRGKSLMVDAISSIGGEMLDMQADHIDWCTGTANKCIEGMPGLSFVCAPRAGFDALATVPPRTYYLNLYGQYVATDKAQAPPFTPAVQTFFAFDVALDLMLSEGVRNRHARYVALAAQLREGLAALGLKFLLPPEHRSSTLTAVYLPDGVSYSDLHDGLKALGFVIYAGQENLRQKVFRLANMGQITAEDVARFLEVLPGVVSNLASRGRGSVR
jgi:2-aminoethylphosphonate-pyruvate transaminase